MPIYTYHCIAVLQNVCISDCMCLTNKPVHITRVNTVIQKVTLSYCGIYKFDRFYNIGHIVYRINLQHNNYWLPRLTYVLLLKHLLKHVNLHSINFSRQSCTLPLHKIIKKFQFIQTVGLHLSLNITASVQLTSFFTLNSLMPFINGIVDNDLQRASIKRCCRSATSWTGIWYTRSCIMSHIWHSTGLRSGLLWGHKSGGMNFEVSRCSRL